MTKLKELKTLSKEIRRLIVTMAYETRSSHLGPALSIADLLTVLYFETLKIKPKSPNWPGRDYFILSKGHAASALYATLAKRGFFPLAKLKQYLVDGGDLPGHPCSDVVPGVEVSTGSLGHGLPIGAGLALSALIDGRKNHTFVLMGDGECDEGSVWEAAKFIGAHQLKQLTVIIDWNKHQGFEREAVGTKEDLQKQWEAFGWQVFLVDGHDLAGLAKVLSTARNAKRPSVVIADTVSGRGIAKVADTLLAHYYVIPDEQKYQEIIQTINEE